MEASGNPHRKYRSSSGFYWDIVMQLHHCQKGLCAYTEIELCDDELFAAVCWKDGQYDGHPGNPGRFGQLEHFDASLKSKKKDTEGKKA